MTGPRLAFTICFSKMPVSVIAVSYCRISVYWQMSWFNRIGFTTDVVYRVVTKMPIIATHFLVHFCGTGRVYRVATFQTTWNSLTFPVAWTGKNYRYTAYCLNSRCFTLIITSIVTNLLKATRVSMMNISKVHAHKLPKAAASTLQIVQSLKQISVSLTFSIFPDHFGIPWLFQVFQVSGHPAV